MHVRYGIHFGMSNFIFVVSVQGTIGCTPNSVPMVFIVFCRDSWGLYAINAYYIGLM